MPLDLKNIHDLPVLEEYLAGKGRQFAQPMNPADSPFLTHLRDHVMIFDGGMGTQVFTFNLSLKDFWDKENCVDVLVLSRPDVVEEIHARYYAAGSDCVETNTFGANKVVLGEFGLSDRCREMNLAAVQLARRAAARFQDGKRRFVAGSIGPGTKSITLGHVSWEVLHDSYYTQALALIEGGVDALLIETQFDLAVAKCAAIACFDALRDADKRLPLMVQVTMEKDGGKMLLGTEMSAAIATLEALPIDVLGMNCATGPELMRQHVEVLSRECTRFLSVQPNAGLPILHEGHTHFPLSPEELVKAHLAFVREFGVNIVGGCCGTTPAHIQAVADALRTETPHPRAAFGRKLTADTARIASLYSAETARQDLSILIIGERTNTNGSKKFKEAILAADMDTCSAMGREQVKEGSHVVDVCVDYVGRDGVPDMTAVVHRFAKDVTAPLMIDSTQLDVIEAGLKTAPGKCIVNSVNLEDGEEKLAKICYLLKRYGAAVVAGTIDEDKLEAMGKTADRKLAIARRLYDLLVNKYGIPETDIYFDPLIFPVVTGQEEVRRLAIETLEGIRRISKEFPHCHTTLGLSNVSFGLKPYARLVINSAFFNECVKAGLTSAIVHASKILPQTKINPEHYQWALDLIYDRNRPDYNPLALLSKLGNEQKTAATTPTENLTIEQKLQRHIIDGDKQNLVEHLDEARLKYAPLDIINNHLLAGMKIVGELFGSGQMQLPFVLQSAEVMKAAVAHLEQFMQKTDGQSRGKLVLATVKGDVHDIGKNLVDIILSNNGFTVFNLGIKQPIDAVVAKAQEVHADAIGLSGLLVKSTLVMRDDLAELNRRDLTIPVILGGAALTRKYVESDLRSLYRGPLFYGKDAFEGLHVMDAISTGKTKDALLATGASEDQAASFCGGGLPTPPSDSRPPSPTARANVPSTSDYAESDITRNAPIPTPPFFGTRLTTDIPLDSLFPYIDEVALFRGQWQYKSGTKSRDEFRAWTESYVRPIYERIKAKVRELHIVHPAVVYGYFPCLADKNDLIIYDLDAHGRPTTNEKLRFHFPRQPGKKRWCLSDFFRPKNPQASTLTTHDFDTVAFTCVTVGPDISAYEAQLRADHDYTEYLYIHGIGVQLAEALAEMWHKRIRQELGIALADGPTPRDLFSCRYQGCRYSFGYPACPNLSDQSKLFELLQPQRIGCGLTESFFITPEQSTSALIAHHPQARYFNVE
jgi:5-methyltetrahydrofolate--homocysteine methyltransferase